MGIQLLFSELDGKKLAFTNKTEFLVQLGKDKGSYKTKLKFFGDEFNRAVMMYNMLNVHSGYKKRLISYNMNKPVLARCITNKGY